MRPEHFVNAIKLLETHQEQRQILSDEEIKDTHQLNENNQIGKDVLLHKDKVHKLIKNVVKR